MKMFKGRNNSLRHQLRRLLTRFRGDYPARLPDFLVIGASRSGTTTLNAVLASHPSIFVPPRKELHYFDNDALYSEDLSGYLQLFGGYRGEPVLGEVTPSYWEAGYVYPSNSWVAKRSEDDALGRIAKALPDVKLVLSLRDPMSRIRSNYTKSFLQGKIGHSLEQELANERSGNCRLWSIRRSQYHFNLRRSSHSFLRATSRS